MRPAVPAHSAAESPPLAAATSSVAREPPAVPYRQSCGAFGRYRQPAPHLAPCRRLSESARGRPSLGGPAAGPLLASRRQSPQCRGTAETGRTAAPRPAPPRQPRASAPAAGGLAPPSRERPPPHRLTAGPLCARSPRRLARGAAARPAAVAGAVPALKQRRRRRLAASCFFPRHFAGNAFPNAFVSRCGSVHPRKAAVSFLIGEGSLRCGHTGAPVAGAAR